MPAVDTVDTPEPVRSELDLEHAPLSEVRQWVRDVLCDLSEDDLDDCLLIANELAGNALDHAAAPRRLRVERSTGSGVVVRIEVDDATQDQPVPGVSRLGDNRGRGLVIVAKIATDWGVEAHSDGKTVWASLVCETHS
ncbi:ATP-binding protein [Actinosynnema sp. NPDC020468]|uniref:ATP-binding protein n=1 Tax=Actinosynnema sp. NPDC020468 TaxID=3154488 RepID=UPI0033BFE414